MLPPDYKLLTLFAIIAAIIILRVSVEKTGYRSPDSRYYLEVSQNILDGKGFYGSNVNLLPDIRTPDNQMYFAVWPLGYPLLIVGVAFVFSLSVFWASKVVNIVFLGLCFFLFRKINKEKAYLLALLLYSFTFIQVFSFTWSEGPFLFGLLWFGYVLQQFLINNKLSLLFQIFCSCLFLFLLRYIGAFSFLMVGGLSLWLFLKKNYAAAIKVLLVVLLLSIIAALYLYNNYLQTGFITGINRLDANAESLKTFFRYLMVGLFNELFIIRKYYIKVKPDLVFLIELAFQLIMGAIVYIRFLKDKEITNSNQDYFSIILGVTGFTYLLVLIVLRWFAPFDPFDYRLLAPFSFCMYTAAILFLIQPNRVSGYAGSYKYIIILFSVALLFNLPKRYLLETFQKLVQSYPGK